MKVDVTARHFELTGSIKDFAQKKVQGLGDLISAEAKTHVILSVEKYLYGAEAVVHADHTSFRAFASSKDLYDAMNKMVQKLGRELTAHHKKVREKTLRRDRQAKRVRSQT